MHNPALPQPDPGLSTGPLARIAAAVSAVARALRRTGAADQTDDLFERFDAHDAFLEKTWPGTHPSDDAVEARNQAVRIREKALRSQARIVTASGWVGVLGKVSATAVGLGVIWRLLIGG